MKTKPTLFVGQKQTENWQDWLAEVEGKLKDAGYTKYFQKYKSSDFQYWKNFDINGGKAYQVGVLFYDFRRYQGRANVPETIGVQFDCLIISDDRIDLSISKDITVADFETISTSFYQSMMESDKLK